MPSLRSNFTHLQEHDEQLLRVGMLAERYFADDPHTCRLNLRQLAELIVQSVASFVHCVDARFALAGRIEARPATKQRLTSATLSKAFRGHLVPQDPNDEPASKLLERLVTTNPKRKR